MMPELLWRTTCTTCTGYFCRCRGVSQRPCQTDRGVSMFSQNSKKGHGTYGTCGTPRIAGCYRPHTVAACGHRTSQTSTNGHPRPFRAPSGAFPNPLGPACVTASRCLEYSGKLLRIFRCVFLVSQSNNDVRSHDKAI